MHRGPRQKTCYLLISLLFFGLLASSVTVFGQEAPAKKAAAAIITETQAQPPASGAEQPVGHVAGRIIGSIVFIVVVFGGFLGYMVYLQRRFFQGCVQEKQMAVFFSSPAGLPVGTIRAMIALLIITVSLSLVVLNVFLPGVGGLPEVLAGLLGTVLGFYFGSRTGGTGDEAATEQIKELKNQRDTAIADQDKTESDTLIGKIKTAITVSKTALDYLPEEEKKKYGGFITTIDQGLQTVETISKAGDLKQAVAKAGEIYAFFKKGNPAQGAFDTAVQAFGQLLGGAIPALAIASSVVALCTKLSGAVYQKWKARILHAPFSPAIMTINVVDANSGLTIMANSPIFKKAFLSELDANDRPFMQLVMGLLGQADVESFWTSYKSRFDSREQFDQGLEEFRRAAIDLDLQGYVPSDQLAEAGGYPKFMEGIDKISADPEAKAALDRLVLVTESLHRSGQPVLTILDRIKSGVKP